MKRRKGSSSREVRVKLRLEGEDVGEIEMKGIKR
jgi:hypothetical protein